MAKNRDLQTFQTDFPKLNDLTGREFVTKLNRNLKMVNDELEIIEKLHKESEDVKTFQSEGQALYAEYSKKGVDGSPVTEVVQSFRGPISQFVIEPSKATELAKKAQALEVKFKKALDIQNEKERDYQETLEGPLKLPFRMIDEDLIPKDITVEQMGILTNINMIKFKDDGK